MKKTKTVNDIAREIFWDMEYLKDGMITERAFKGRMKKKLNDETFAECKAILKKEKGIINYRESVNGVRNTEWEAEIIKKENWLDALMN